MRFIQNAYSINCRVLKLNYTYILSRITLSTYTTIVLYMKSNMIAWEKGSLEQGWSQNASKLSCLRLLRKKIENE